MATENEEVSKKTAGFTWLSFLLQKFQEHQGG